MLTDINVCQQDIVYAADKHHAVLTDVGAEGVPDLIIEILSPPTAMRRKPLST